LLQTFNLLAAISCSFSKCSFPILPYPPEQSNSHASPNSKNRHSTYGRSSVVHAAHAVHSVKIPEQMGSWKASHPPWLPVEGNLPATQFSHSSPVPSPQLLAFEHA
jgi:hypothetical protein